MYPIHIVVNRGRILLVGAVDSEADKTLAGLRARGIQQVSGVENALEVVRVDPDGTRRGGAAIPP